MALDTGNLRRTASTLLPDRGDIATTSGSTLCVALFRSPAVDCMHTPDPTVTATMLLPTTALSIASADTAAWALAGAPARLFRVAVGGGQHVTQIELSAGATAVAVSRDYVWVLYGASGKLLRLPADGSGARVTVELGHPASGLTTWRDEVLASVT